MTNGSKLYALGDVCRKLQVPPHAINYLFNKGALDKADFAMVAGMRLFTEAQVRQIARLLSDK